MNILKALAEFDLKRLFGLQKKFLIGLDIGTYYIKWVVAQPIRKKERAVVKVKNLGYVESVPLENKEAVAEKLRDIFRENNFDPSIFYPVVSISGSQIIVRPVRIKKREGATIDELVYEEAQKYIPYNIETEANLVHQILEESLPDEPDTAEVLLIAAPIELINSIEEILLAADLKREAIEVDVVAIWRLLAFLNLETFYTGTVAVIDMGAYSTGITIYSDGKLRHARTLSIGGNDFTSKLIDNLGLTPEAAEEFKRNYGYIKVEDEDEAPSAEHAKTSVIFKEIVDNLVRELKRSFLYYRSRYKGKPIERVLITGGASLISNLDVYLSKSLKVPVERFNPLDYCQLPGKLKKSIDHKMGSLFTIATGLALRAPSQ